MPTLSLLAILLVLFTYTSIWGNTYAVPDAIFTWIFATAIFVHLKRGYL